MKQYHDIYYHWVIRRDLSMHKIKIAFGEKEKKVKLDDILVDIGVRKGLIEKVDDGYVFIGDYEEFLEFKQKKNMKTYDWLEWSDKRGGDFWDYFDSPLLASHDPSFTPLI